MEEKKTGKLGICSVCHEQKPISGASEDSKICNDCMVSVDECPCTLCQFEDSTDKWVGTYETYEDHLLAKHNHEGLAGYISTKAKWDRDERYRV